MQKDAELTEISAKNMFFKDSAPLSIALRRGIVSASQIAHFKELT